MTKIKSPSVEDIKNIATFQRVDVLKRHLIWRMVYGACGMGSFSVQNHLFFIECNDKLDF